MCPLPLQKSSPGSASCGSLFWEQHISPENGNILRSIMLQINYPPRDKRCWIWNRIVDFDICGNCFDHRRWLSDVYNPVYGTKFACFAGAVGSCIFCDPS